MTTPIETFGEFIAWDGNRLHVDTDDPRGAVLRKSALSPSTAHSFADGCQSRWAIEQLLPRDQGPMEQASLGTSAHSVLEDLFSLDADQRTQEAALELISTMDVRRDDIVVPPEPMQREAWRGIITGYVSTLWKVMDPRTIDVVATERHMSDVEIGGVPVNGFIDLQTRDGIVDWKFPKKPPRWANHYPDQIRTYALAIEAADGKLPKRGNLVYVNHAIVDPVNLSRPALDATKRMFVDAWSDLQAAADAQTYTTEVSPLCGWCPLVSVCPSGLEARKVAKVDKARLGIEMNIRSLEALKTKRAAASEQDGVVDTAQARRTDAPDETPEENSMAPDPNRPYTEEPRWHEKQNASGMLINGSELGANSFAAAGISGYVAKAYEILMTQEWPATVAVNSATTQALAASMHAIVQRVQYNLVGDGVGTNFGLTQRIRGALYTFLDHNRPPLGGSEDEWRAWLNQAMTMTKAFTDMTFAIYDAGATGQKPYAALVDPANLVHPKADG